jgi:lipid-binding SYLF domain-containing protein
VTILHEQIPRFQGQKQRGRAMTITRRHALGTIAATTAATALPLSALAAEAATIDARVNLALGKLWKQVSYARDLSTKAKAMLVMPEVVKGGFIIGGAYGEGSLLLNDPVQGYEKKAGYYSVAIGSIGLQIGVQTTSHVLFFMTDGALAKFRAADGWEAGVDAEVTFPDAGLNTGLDTTTAQKPVIGVVFAEDGLLIGASLAGAKYSPIQR